MICHDCGDTIPDTLTRCPFCAAEIVPPGGASVLLAKHLVETPPQVIARALPLDQAESLRLQFAAIDADVRLRPAQ